MTTPIPSEDPPSIPNGRRMLGLVLFGFGSVGQAVLELALQRPWLEVRGIVARDPSHDGMPARERVAGAGRTLRVSTNAASTLAAARPDVVIVATQSTLRDVLPQLELAAAAAPAVACTAEELAYIERSDSPEAAAVFALAERHRTAILGTGINPGFVLDLFPLLLARLAWDVRRIHGRRVVDVSVFGPRVRAKLGIGYAAADFDREVAAGNIVGHLGFRESIRLLCATMGRPLERVELAIEPLYARAPIVLADGTIAAGGTAGVSQRATGWVAGDPWIELELMAHVAPGEADELPGDRITLTGRHTLSATISPGTGAILGTAAHLVNSIPAIVAAQPGVYHPAALPGVAPWLAPVAPVPTSPRNWHKPVRRPVATAAV